MSSVTELGERRQHARDELSRIEKFPARILRMSEEDKDAAVTSLKQELELIDQEIQAEAGRVNARHLSQVYGTAPVAEDAESAKAELETAQKALQAALDGFEATCKGYARKVRDAQLRVFDAAGNAGQAVRRPDMVLSGVAMKLAAMVENTVKHG